jgi:hypothetical protein
MMRKEETIEAKENTQAYDEIFPYVPEAMPLPQKIRKLINMFEQAERVLAELRATDK